MKVYLGASKGISFISRLIRWRQWGYPYTHTFYVGTELPDKMADLVVIEAWWEGVIKGRFSKTHTPGTKFTLFSVTVTPRQAKRIDDFMESLIGKKYDWLGLLGFVFYSKRIESKKRWFCSESIFAALLNSEKVLLRDTRPAEVSPRLLLKSPLLKHIGDFVLP